MWLKYYVHWSLCKTADFLVWIYQQIPGFCEGGSSIPGIEGKVNCEIIVGYKSVYRMCFAMACFFFLFSIIMIRVRSSKDPRAAIQNGYNFIICCSSWHSHKIFLTNVALCCWKLGFFYIWKIPFLHNSFTLSRKSCIMSHSNVTVFSPVSGSSSSWFWLLLLWELSSFQMEHSTRVRKLINKKIKTSNSSVITWKKFFLFRIFLVLW